MNESRRFEEKVALITGAASGIGRAVSFRLASEGARVFGHDLNADGLAETAGLVANAGGTMQTRAGDISEAAECNAAVAACVETFGRLDVLGNNAGIARADHVLDVTEEQYRRMMGVNVDGYFFMAQAGDPASARDGRQHRERRIERRGDGPGLHGRLLHDEGCSGAARTRALAMEFVKTNIRVNAIAPSGIQTTLSENFHIPSDVDGSLMRPYMGFRPMGSPDDIAAMFAFVASDEAASVHGAILAVDRGVTAG